jgi:hypothetical protein
VSVVRSESRIDAVTVYRSGALVRRVAEIDGAAERMRLTGLPLSIDDTSVRVWLEPSEAGAEGRVATAVKVLLLPAENAAGLAPAEDPALRAARAEAERLGAEMDAARGALERLGRLPLASRPRSRRGEPPAPTPVDARIALLAWQAEERVRLLDALDALETARARAQLAVEDLEERERRASSARQARLHELRKAVEVKLEGHGKARRAWVEYLVPGARWAPAYTLRLTRDMRQATLTARAAVCQRTGEDWQGVRLVLSTAAPQRWTRLPELAAIRIGRRQPPPARAGWRAPAVGAEALYADFDRASLLDPPPPIGARKPKPRAGGGARKLAALAPSAAPPPPQPGVPPPFAAPPPPPVPAPPPAPRAPAAFGAPVAMAARAAFLGDDAYPAPGAAAPAAELDTEASDLRAEPPPVTLHAGDALLDYGRLRMAQPTAPGRGKLRPATTDELYLELVVEQRIELRVDVARSVARAEREAAAAGEQSPPPGHVFAAAEDGFDYAYPARDRADVASDGAFHAVTLEERTGPARPRLIAVPRESQQVFRSVELDNPLDAPLLPGPLDVYQEGTFLTTAELSATPARGRVRLGLGVEQAVKLARNATFEERTAGLLRGSRDLAHEVVVEVVSHLEHAATLEVRERVPVAREGDDDIKVTIGDVSPPWEPWEPHEGALRGGHRWVIELEPRASSELRHGYVVRIPGRAELVGGNRRES